MSLGYGNFVTVIQYDIYAMAEKFISEGSNWSSRGFAESDFALQFTTYESNIVNSPNLSLFPLLAVNTYIAANPDNRSAVGFKAFCDSSSTYSDVFVCDGIRPYRDWETDRKSTRLNSSHSAKSRMPSSA